MEKAVLTATSALNDRGPEKARLNGMLKSNFNTYINNIYFYFFLIENFEFLIVVVFYLI